MSNSENPITPPPTPADETAPVEAKKTDSKSESGMTCFKRLAVATESVDLPDEQKEILMKLKEFQESHLKLEEEYRREWNELKLKYLAKFQPLYVSRRKELRAEAVQGPGTTNLPQFWVKAMKNHLLLSEMIEEHDVPILSHLEDIVFQWIDPREQTSFKLDFYFSSNEYFDNPILSKTYHLERAEDDDEESVLTKTEGTKVEWKTGRNVTEKTITRKQRNKRTNQTRTITEVLEDNSFFNFFQSHEIPSEEQLESMEEREVAELEMIVEAEFEVGCILRDKIIPRALGWYLGIEKDEDAESDAMSGAPENDDFDEEDEDDDSE